MRLEPKPAKVENGLIVETGTPVDWIKKEYFSRDTGKSRKYGEIVSSIKIQDQRRELFMRRVQPIVP
jgi:hypothetical protein